MPLANTKQLAATLSDCMNKQSYTTIITYMVQDIDKIYWNDIHRQRLHDYIEANIDIIEDERLRKQTIAYNQLLKKSIGNQLKDNSDCRENFIIFAEKLNTMLGRNLSILLGDNLFNSTDELLSLGYLQPEYIVKVIDYAESLMNERKSAIAKISNIYHDNIAECNKLAKLLDPTHGENEFDFLWGHYPSVKLDDNMIACLKSIANQAKEINTLREFLDATSTRIRNIGMSLLQNTSNNCYAFNDKNLQDKFANIIAQTANIQSESTKLFITGHITIKGYYYNNEIEINKLDDTPMKFYEARNGNYTSIIADTTSDWQSVLISNGNEQMASRLQYLFGEENFMDLAIKCHLRRIVLNKNFAGSTRKVRDSITLQLLNTMGEPGIKTLVKLLDLVDSQDYYLVDIVRTIRHRTLVVHSSHNQSLSIKSVIPVMEALLNKMSKKLSPKDATELLTIKSRNQDSIIEIKKVRPLTQEEENAFAALDSIIQQMVDFKPTRKKKAS